VELIPQSEVTAANDRKHAEYEVAIRRAAELIDQSRSEASEYATTPKRVAELVRQANEARDAEDADRSTSSSADFLPSQRIGRQVKLQTDQAATISHEPAPRTGSASSEDTR
jgi:hypothetical protein